MLRSTFAALLALVATPSDAPCQDGGIAQDEQATYMGRAFVFEADLGWARAAGWLGDEGDQAVRARLETALLTRVRRLGRFPEARVLAEPEDRFVVVFVGRQDPRIEEFLVAGLAPAGRLAVRRVATDEDLEGSSLAAERERLDAWRSQNPGRDPVYFTALPPDEGGPHPDLEWRLAHTVLGEVREALPLLRDGEAVLDRHDLARGMLFAESEEGSEVTRLRFDLEAEAAARVAAFRGEGPEHALVIEVDGLVAALFEPGTELGPTVRLGPFTSEEARALVLAVSGETLPAPLRFVEYSKRELLGVVPKGE